MTKEVKLFGMWASPFSRRIELALKLKGVEYEYIEEDLSNKSPLLLKYNPVHKKVPVLVHNDNPIAESLVILEYIDETWKDHPLLPQNAYQRAMTRFWAKVIDDKFVPALWPILGTKEDEQSKAIEENNHLLKMLEKELKGNEFFGGDGIGYLDIVANVIAFWYLKIQETLELELLTEDEFPLLYKWIGKLNEVAVFTESCPPSDELIAYLKGVHEKLKAGNV